MSLQAEIQGLASDTLIELFVLDATAIGGALYRFHAGLNVLKGPVVWQGQTYSPMPIEASGFEYTGNGKLPRPSLRVQNVDGLVGALVDAYQDLIGAVVTRKRTLLKYLDAVNFPDGLNPTADDTAEFPEDVYAIGRKSSHTKAMIEFELMARSDVQGLKVPRRQIIQSVCTWKQYRGPECGYIGPPVATRNDVPTVIDEEDECGRRVASCKMRFGEFGVLPFGGFPGVGVVRAR